MKLCHINRSGPGFLRHTVYRMRSKPHKIGRLSRWGLRL